MEITSRIFWREAAKGGTIIGLVVVAFNLLKYAVSLADVSFWGSFLGFVAFVVYVMLVYGFTRRISSMAPADQGFPYSRSLGFIVAMMLFVGILVGVYMALFNNFVNPEAVTAQIDAAMLIYQDMIPDNDFDRLYNMMVSMMYNPLYLVFAGIFTYVLQGVFVGLIVSVFTKRNPDIFADNIEE